ncbi:MAG: four helix bundle protein [Calditrichaeota bacterium]|nr:four helix bundle protein [Calditrichota bacterium]RQV98783.1 MAG: four helix bundle protein [Calditrichota bacterium]
MGNQKYLRFEDLEVWQRAAKLSAEIYKNLKILKDYGFRDQITKTSLSISSNIAEGFERQSHKEFIKFLIYAKGSCGELRSQIHIGIVINYIDSEAGKCWQRETVKISSMLSNLIKTRRTFLKNSL